MDVLRGPIHEQARIGHVHLRVADIERSLKFYQGILGFRPTQFWRGAVFLAAGDYHHHLALNTWQSLGGPPPPLGCTGLFHVAILYPTLGDLGDALRRLQAANWPLDGVTDHGVSIALYVRDPDQNGVELYWDRPESEWPRDSQGMLAMGNAPVNIEELLGEGNT